MVANAGEPTESAYQIAKDRFERWVSWAPTAYTMQELLDQERLLGLGISNRRCMGLFEELLSQVRGISISTRMKNTAKQVVKDATTHNSSLIEILRRFVLWSYNVGANCHDLNKNYAISLDYRLREAKYYRTTILEILQNLKELLLEANTMYLKIRLDAGEFQGGFQLSGTQAAGARSDSRLHGLRRYQIQYTPPRTDRGTPHHSDDCGYESQLKDLLEKSDLGLSESGSESGLQELTDEESMDSDQHPDSETNISTTQENLAMHFERLVKSMEVIIKCLYSLQLRQPATAQSRHVNNDHNNVAAFYKHYDIMYVKDAFPDLDSVVADRLGQLITRRRGILAYRKEHHDRLMNRVPDRLEHAMRGTMRREGTQADDRSTQYAPTARTKATTLQEELSTETSAFRLPAVMQANLDFDHPDALSEVSSVASSAATKKTRLKYPKRPKGPDGETLAYFICPICHIAQNINSEHSWRQHVLKDMVPYVCTHRDCPKPMEIFSNRKEWRKHEIDFHQGRWFCNTEGHEIFDEDSQFLEHMALQHSIPNLDSTNIHNYASMFRLAPTSQIDTCPLCKHTTSQRSISKHLGRHLEQIALRAIPTTYYDDTSDEGNSNSEEHLSHGLSSRSSVGHNSARPGSAEENKESVAGDGSEDESDTDNLEPPKQVPESSAYYRKFEDEPQKENNTDHQPLEEKATGHEAGEDTNNGPDEEGEIQDLSFEPNEAEGNDTSSGEILCICGVFDDDGFTIRCGNCNTWQHSVCVGIAEQEVPRAEDYLCPTCQPRNLDAEKARKYQLERLLERDGIERRAESDEQPDPTESHDNLSTTSGTELNEARSVAVEEESKGDRTSESQNAAAPTGSEGSVKEIEDYPNTPALESDGNSELRIRTPWTPWTEEENRILYEAPFRKWTFEGLQELFPSRSRDDILHRLAWTEHEDKLIADEGWLLPELSAVLPHRTLHEIYRRMSILRDTRHSNENFKAPSATESGLVQGSTTSPPAPVPNTPTSVPESKTQLPEQPDPASLSVRTPSPSTAPQPVDDE